MTITLNFLLVAIYICNLSAFKVTAASSTNVSANITASTHVSSLSLPPLSYKSTIISECLNLLLFGSYWHIVSTWVRHIKQVDILSCVGHISLRNLLTANYSEL